MSPFEPGPSQQCRNRGAPWPLLQWAVTGGRIAAAWPGNPRPKDWQGVGFHCGQSVPIAYGNVCPRYRWNVDLIQYCICQYSHINLLSPEPWLSSPTRIERRQNPHQKHITWSNQQLTMIELTEWEHHGYRYECYTWRNSLQISLHSMNGFPHNIHIVGCEHIQQCEHIKKKKQTIL